MKTQIVRLVLAAGLAALPGLLQAQPTAHYAPGVEGIKAASLPPPGIYFRDYNYFYTADQLNDASGNKNGPADLDLLIYANLPRVLWITDTKFLGGFVGVDGFLPIFEKQASTNTPGGPFSGNTLGIGDLYAEGTLSWHLKQFDFAVASGVSATAAVMWGALGEMSELISRVTAAVAVAVTLVVSGPGADAG